MNKAMTRALIGIWAPLLLATGAVAGEKTPDARPGDPMASCAQMMQDTGVTEEGKKAMQEFMQSPRAHEAMDNMMAMARRMGNGDVMLGMTRMMEMMGSMGGGMMGGKSGMMTPGARQPAK